MKADMLLLVTQAFNQSSPVRRSRCSGPGAETHGGAVFQRVVAQSPSAYAAIGGGRRTGEKYCSQQFVHRPYSLRARWCSPSRQPPSLTLATQIPGNGFFRVGPDIAPGLYHTGGTTSTIGVWINNLPTPDEMCSWFTYSTPDPQKDHVVQANSSMAPMYANIPTTIKAFE
jgi:hypothetical protein